MSTTCAGCHDMCGAATPGAGSAASVTLVPLLEPRGAAGVVAVLLPEPGLIVIEHPQTRDELRALPEIEVRHEEAGRPSVGPFERLALVVPHDPCLAAGHVRE